LVQAKAFKDYIPLGLYEEWPPPNLRQLKKIGGDILVLLLVLKGRTEMSVEDLEKFNVNHKLLAENNVIRIYDRVAYLNCDNKIFRYLLVQEESLDGKTAKKRVLKVKSEPEKVKKPRKTPRPRPLHNDEVQEILGLMNELRAKANLPYPLHYNADNFDQIKYMLGKYSKHDLLLGIKNYFGWILEEKEERMYGGDKVKSILNNFESKLSIAKRMNPQWRDGREAQLAKKDDPLSKLYNIFVLNWDDINSKNVKIIIDGNIERRKIASLAYRIFRKKLGDETPATHKSPEKLWRGCWSEAKKRGGLGSTADDDLNINGSLHSVRIVTFKGE
tara:strand:- start:1045 stop:2037 length:993 start_codon:yes stop_codon:yes gene_type:complete